MTGYIALGICFFIFGYQYAVRRKRERFLLGKPMKWHTDNFDALLKLDPFEAELQKNIHKAKSVSQERKNELRGLIERGMKIK